MIPPALTPHPILVVLLVALLLLVLLSPPPDTCAVTVKAPKVVGVTVKGKFTFPLAGTLGAGLVQVTVVVPEDVPATAQVQPLPPPLLNVKPAGKLKLSDTIPELAPEPTFMTLTV